MVIRSKIPCRQPGCSVLLDVAGYCSKHRAARQKLVDDRRGTAARRGYGAKWQKARETYLTNHPLCVMHQAQGEVAPATVVDHIVPHRGDQKLFWDRNNWQPLCKQCHDRKTATEDGAFGRPAAPGEGKSLG